MSPEARKVFLDAMVNSGMLSLHKCPNTGKIIESTGSDDKALCGCGKSNPRIPSESPGLHVKSFLMKASADEYIAQEQERRKAG